MNGATCLVQTLKQLGVSHIFGYPGGAIMPVYDALDDDIKHVLCRHEQGCAFAAQGYARSSNKVGVCLATSGPGATNLVTGIADAYMDSIPLLVITGQVETSLIGTDAFQEIDFIGMTLGIVKHSYQVRDADELASIVCEAYGLAMSGRPGPVLIDLPKDIQRQTLSECPLPIASTPEIHAGRPTAFEINNVAKSIRQATHPVLIVGGGIKHARAEAECIAVAEKYNVNLSTTLNCIGLLPENHVNYLGMLGMHGTPEANDSIQTADLLICIGARFDDRATGNIQAFAPHAKIIHIDIDPAEFNKNVKTDICITADAKVFLSALLAIPATIPVTIASAIKTKRQSPSLPIPINKQAANQATNKNTIYAPALLQEFIEHLPLDFITSVDVGQHQMWVAQHLKFHRPQQFMTSAGLGTMGFGLPAAIGAQMADPEKLVINITGDGSFMMNVQELATINRYKLPVKILLLNNQHLGLVRQQQELFYGERYSAVDLSDNPDFIALTAAFGFQGRSINKPLQVSDALNWFVTTEGPTILEVNIPAQENVWPFVIPGKGNHERLNGTIYEPANEEDCANAI